MEVLRRSCDDIPAGSQKAGAQPDHHIPLRAAFLIF